MPTPERPGQFLGWRWLNQVVDALRRRRLIASQHIGVIDTPGGQVPFLKRPQEVYVRITGGANPYSGVEQRWIAGGLPIDLVGGRTFSLANDPLYERNRNTAVPVGAIVFAQRDPSSRTLLFDRTVCGNLTTTTPTPSPKPAPAPNPALSPDPAPTPLAPTDGGALGDGSLFDGGLRGSPAGAGPSGSIGGLIPVGASNLGLGVTPEVAPGGGPGGPG